ncbi:hypothetical protein Fmac_028853 [Flemingia macrophylla]|uniref:Uncharacterized protein n=1 Tax=Flemingia macrophylla TaxID=520843 RepID=A0ABD1L8N5_9FABA
MGGASCGMLKLLVLCISCLRNCETLYDLFLFSFYPTLAEIATLASYDFIVVDMEYGVVVDALPCLHNFPSPASATHPPHHLRLSLWPRR